MQSHIGTLLVEQTPPFEAQEAGLRAVLLSVKLERPASARRMLTFRGPLRSFFWNH